MNVSQHHLISRMKELPVWLGIPFAGALAGEHFFICQRFLVFAASMVFAMGHVLILNDWGDLGKNPLELDRYPGHKNINVMKMALGLGAAILFVLGVALYAGLVTIKVLLAFSVGGLVLNALYSHPRIHLKESVVGSSVLHFLGGILQFLLGYFVFSDHWQSGIIIGVFFSLIFMGGHFIHECLDIEEDARGQVRTRAIRFGVAPVLKSALIVFFGAHAFLLIVAASHMVNPKDALVFTFPVIAHWHFLRILVNVNLPTREMLIEYRRKYRFAYACGGAAYFICRIL